MAWFCWINKRYKKEENRQITLQDVRNSESNIEWLKWKYSNLSKHKIHKSVCLLCIHRVEPQDTDDEANEEKEDFIEGIKKKPHKKREFINSKTGTHLLWNNGKLVRMNTEQVDWSCLKKTASEYKIAASYWAYIYMLVRDGILGSDMSGLSIDKFIEKMKGFNVGSRSTIFEYSNKRGTYPNYLPASTNLKKYELEKIKIKNFVTSFVEIYYQNLNRQIPLEDIDSVI